MGRPPGGSELAGAWTLDPDVAFLNHGSFGACPRAVLDAQRELVLRMERQPVHFFVRDMLPMLDAARESLARFVGADPEGLVPVTNTTSAVSAVVRSLRLGPGDELLTTDHAYGACRNALDEAAARTGARVVVAAVPFPLRAASEVVDAVLGAATPRTRFALLDHVTSPTGLVFPVEDLVAALGDRGVDVMVDGAHAPGMLELDVARIGASWYAGNCHKWLCAPKGAAFLHAREDKRETARPIATSHGYSSRRRGRSWLHDQFDWPGTADPTPFLSVPAAIDHVGSLVPGGWSEIRARNRALALAARGVLCEALGVDEPCPSAMLGSLAAVPLQDGGPLGPRWAMDTDPLQDELLERFAIEVPIVPWPQPPRRLVRVSAQVYNALPQYRWLADALVATLRRRSR